VFPIRHLFNVDALPFFHKFPNHLSKKDS